MNHFRTILLSLIIVSGIVSTGVLCAHASDAVQGKTLILYYSKTGNTRAACEALQKELGADIREIKDLNSRETKFGAIAGMLKTLLGMHTDIDPKTIDLSPYSTVIISAPIWAAKFGLAMRTYVETNRFDNKNVIIFITADVFIEEKYQEKHKALVQQSGGTVIGYFQTQAADLINKEKIPRAKEKIVADTLKLVPEIRKIIK